MIWDVTQSVPDIVDRITPNKGWIIKDPNVYGGANIPWFIYYTKESQDSAYNPLLEIKI